MCSARTWLAAMLLCASPWAWAELANAMRDHPSPYLALHGDDPVAWQAWNTETVARARRENKLLFVSVGYFACHWCHVMQRESYKHPEIAARLNRDFIPVKVDRELHSGLDDTLQRFSSRLNGIAGWPLNAFVTPDGYPAFVVLYARPDEFVSLVERLAGRWRSDAAGIARLARQAAPPPAPAPAVHPDRAAYGAQATRAFLSAVWQEADHFKGGFGQVSKFPHAPQLDALLALEARQHDPKRAEFLRLTLDQMASRGLHDAIGGGFFRYTEDPSWETPHFEKMLYDNAHLARLYLRAARVLNQPRYTLVARSTLDFMRHSLMDASGGLATSVSAVDAEGREGAAYLWEPGALRQALPADIYTTVRKVWQLDAPRPFEYGYLPIEHVTPGARERRHLDQAARMLRPLRPSGNMPLDHKRNAGLNGLALSAFSEAAALDPAYRAAADRVQSFLVRHLVRGDSLMKSRAGGHTLAGAELEDYAYVVRGLLDHAAATGNRQSRLLAQRLARTAWARFWNEQGWLREAHPLLATTAREPALADGALYSPSEVLISASLNLDDTALAQRARTARAWQVPVMSRDPFVYPSRMRVLALD